MPGQGLRRRERFLPFLALSLVAQLPILTADHSPDPSPGSPDLSLNSAFSPERCGCSFWPRHAPWERNAAGNEVGGAEAEGIANTRSVSHRPAGKLTPLAAGDLRPRALYVRARRRSLGTVGGGGEKSGRARGETETRGLEGQVVQVRKCRGTRFLRQVKVGGRAASERGRAPRRKNNKTVFFLSPPALFLWLAKSSIAGLFSLPLSSPSPAFPPWAL